MIAMPFRDDAFAMLMPPILRLLPLLIIDIAAVTRHACLHAAFRYCHAATIDDERAR